MNLTQILGCVAAACLLTTSVVSAADEGYDNEGRAGFGAFVTPPTLEELARLDLTPGDGGIVRRVRPGSTAESLGLQPGDVVRSINDAPIQSFRDVRALVRTVAPGDDVRVVVTDRDGVTQVLDGTFKVRQPRPSGMPPWGRGQPPWATAGGMPPWQAPEDIISEQRQQLINDKQRLDAIAAELATTRASLAAAQGSEAWYCTVSIHHE